MNASSSPHNSPPSRTNENSGNNVIWRKNPNVGSVDLKYVPDSSYKIKFRISKQNFYKPSDDISSTESNFPKGFRTVYGEFGGGNYKADKGSNMI